jgi:hypothetical protein
LKEKEDLAGGLERRDEKTVAAAKIYRLLEGLP